MQSVEDHPGPVLQNPEAHRGEYDEDSFLDAIERTSRALDGAGIQFVFMGGLASTIHGRPRWTHDLDIFVKPQEALHALDALKQSGFQTERTDEAWLYKAFLRHVMVDIIFKSKGGIYLDDEMWERSIVADFKGHAVRFIPPEDLVVIKAAVADEVSPRHWHDALGILAAQRMDWEYFLKRARASPRRALALLCYAQSDDLLVPNRVIRRLFHDLYDS